MSIEKLKKAVWALAGTAHTSSTLTEDDLVINRDMFEDMVAVFREKHFAPDATPSMAFAERRAAKAEAWRAALVDAHAFGWLSDYARDEMLARNPYKEKES